MKRLPHTLGWASAMLLLLPACRQLVWEDRSRCPVQLGLYIVNADAFPPEERLHVAVFGASEDAPAAADSTRLQALQDGDFAFSLLPADHWNGYGVLGFSRSRLEAPARWIIPEGADADPLYRFAFHTEGFEGSAVLPVELVKDHTKVQLRFVHYERFGAPGGQFPFQVTLLGNSCGLDGCSGLPLEGPFRHRPEEISAGEFRFVLPRQADDGLQMEIWAKPGLTRWEGRVDCLNLGALLRKSGQVNWEAKNLPDVELTLDYGEARLTIQVQNWEETVSISYDL